MYKRIVQLITVFAIILIAGYLIYQNGINSKADENGEEKIFVVSKGEGARDVAKNLEKENLIKSELFFTAYIWKNNLKSSIKAGEYNLNQKLTIKEVADVLTNGDVLNKEKIITTIEGWTAREIGEYLQKESLFSSDEFLNFTGSQNNFASDSKFDFLNDRPAGSSLEGYLFPDTYRIFKDATLEDVVGKMLDNFSKKFTQELRAEIKKQNKSVHEIITMASIIEEEVRTEEDMKIVSGLFWDRIKYGQALQSDATLSYALGESKGQHSYEETKIDSPFNSYKYKGLPPGPICNPGFKAIMAAIYPTYTDYNYFLNRLDTGETIFSRTYDEHLRNKAKYLK